MLKRSISGASWLGSTCRSGVACTTASAPRSPGSRVRWRSDRSFVDSPKLSSTGTRSGTAGSFSGDSTASRLRSANSRRDIGWGSGVVDRHEDLTGDRRPERAILPVDGQDERPVERMLLLDLDLHTRPQSERVEELDDGRIDRTRHGADGAVARLERVER